LFTKEKKQVQNYTLSNL